MRQFGHTVFGSRRLNGRPPGISLLVAIYVLILACTGGTFAATNNVSFGSFFFRPSSITLAEGDTVIWTHTNTDLVNHTVTGTGSEKICGSNLVPVSCSHTFPTAGTYPYLCTVDSHAAFGMIGMVNVVTPRHLNHKQRELYEQLAESLTAHNLRTDESVFGKLRRAFGGH